MRKRMQIMLDENLKKDLGKVAEDKYCSQSTIINLALAEYFKRDKKNEKNMLRNLI